MWHLIDILKTFNIFVYILFKTALGVFKERFENRITVIIILFNIIWLWGI